MIDAFSFANKFASAAILMLQLVKIYTVIMSPEYYRVRFTRHFSDQTFWKNYIVPWCTFIGNFLIAWYLSYGLTQWIPWTFGDINEQGDWESTRNTVRGVFTFICGVMLFALEDQLLIFQNIKKIYYSETTDDVSIDGT